MLTRVVFTVISWNYKNHSPVTNTCISITNLIIQEDQYHHKYEQFKSIDHVSHSFDYGDKLDFNGSILGRKHGSILGRKQPKSFKLGHLATGVWHEDVSKTGVSIMWQWVTFCFDIMKTTSYGLNLLDFIILAFCWRIYHLSYSSSDLKNDTVASRRHHLYYYTSIQCCIAYIAECWRKKLVTPPHSWSVYTLQQYSAQRTFDQLQRTRLFIF